MSLASTDAPRRHRHTVSDYHRMAEVGILAPDARVELIDGDIIDMVPPGKSHVAALLQLSEMLFRAAGNEASVLVQSPLRLSELSEPQPDLALLKRREDFYRQHEAGAGDVLLVVEVADTSLRFDRDTKVSLYAVHGIPEMWLVDLRGRRLVRYRSPHERSYTLFDEPDLGLPIALSALAGVVVDLRQLFGG